SANSRSGSGLKKEPSANHSGFRLHRKAGSRAAKRDRVARSFGATAPSTRNAGTTAPSRYHFGGVGRVSKKQKLGRAVPSFLTVTIPQRRSSRVARWTKKAG